MTIRIDTARNRLDATIRLLQIIRDEIGDLHVLATDRTAADERLHVLGGDPDYALDSHGDPRARDAYDYLTELTIPACELLVAAAHAATKILRTGDSPRPRTRRVISRDELTDALDAQTRRRTRGEYSPLRRYPQPQPGQ